MARRATASYDEGDVRVRPGRGSRPRSKRRPAHADARRGLVTAVDRGRYTCFVDGAPTRTVTAMSARELGRKAVVVGDQVGLVGDVSGQPGSLARIVRVEERATVLRRTADDDDPVERIVVANADQLLVVTAVTDPEPRPRLIDRCLVAAFDAGIEPLLCVTKADLADPAPLLATYAPLDVPTVVTRATDDGGIDASSVVEHLRDRVTALVGHSGVGKSTLVNELVPGADRVTGEVNVVTGRGRHTSTSAVALPVPAGGWVIDTPGIRSFGLAHVDPARLILAFPDLAAETADCPRGCTHAADEPECALDAALATGRVDRDRLDSFRRLLASRDRQAGD
ncbi:ribosome small subunit-dependent GTPase A [Jiangella asiatica]|uniref:Small ribosomal subunit biogenesis GTPase RsgA n=1 Tax=Jiangella asiatica TaxID=2530372 RepID=A0A4R5DV58_9ACTN|nr:ribosome small subunit-dependent GTPase A [Jiangella asiatica]TDE15115.1 ribosome small subunit-dependent GTPase A [Jiangella asiatica]